MLEDLAGGQRTASLKRDTLRDAPSRGFGPLHSAYHAKDAQCARDRKGCLQKAVEKDRPRDQVSEPRGVLLQLVMALPVVFFSEGFVTEVAVSFRETLQGLGTPWSYRQVGRAMKESVGPLLNDALALKRILQLEICQATPIRSNHFAIHHHCITTLP